MIQDENKSRRFIQRLTQLEIQTMCMKKICLCYESVKETKPQL